MVQSFEKEFMESNPRYAFMVEYMRKAVEKEEVEWGDLTTLAMRRISECICESVSGNTACTYLAVLKAFLAHYIDEGLVPCKNPNKELKAKKLPSQHIALTEAALCVGLSVNQESYRPRCR